MITKKSQAAKLSGFAQPNLNENAIYLKKKKLNLAKLNATFTTKLVSTIKKIVLKLFKNCSYVVCQTEYINKNVTEDQTECKTVDEEMCEDGICVQVPKRECETFQIESLKAIPSTTCDQKKQEICVTPSCPLVSKCSI